MDKETELQFARIDKILGDLKEKGDGDLWESCYCEYLKNELKFPIKVTGIEDFNWEEFYCLGPGDPDEYKKLKKTQPSYEDIYILKSICKNDLSEWIMCGSDDIGAHVIREKDKKEFILGLSELECVTESDKMHQLIYDYSVFFCNYR